MKSYHETKKSPADAIVILILFFFFDIESHDSEEGNQKFMVLMKITCFDNLIDIILKP